MNEASFTQGLARNASESEYPNLWRGLVGLWCPSVGLQGQKLIDFASSNHGVLTNGTLWSPGRRGVALDFDGTDDYVDIPFNSRQNVNAPMTVTAWVFMRSYGGSGNTYIRGIVGKYISGAGNEFFVRVGNSGSAGGAGVLNCGGNGAVSAPSNFPLNTWTHVGMTNTSSGSTTLWQNGLSIATGSGSVSAGSDGIRIGQDFSSGGRVWDGKIDDVRLYNRVLSPQEMMQSFMGASPLVRRVPGVGYKLAAGGSALTLSLSDGVTLGETRGGASAFNRAPGPDALSLAETLARVAAFARSLADGLALGESATSSAAFVRLQSDALTLAESLSKSAAFARSASDAVAIGESLSAIVVLIRTLSDGLTLGDSIAIQAGRAASLADAISLSETVSRSANYLRLVMDSLSLAENLARVSTWSRGVADALHLGDSARALILGRTIPALNFRRPRLGVSRFSAGGSAGSFRVG